MFKYNLSQTSQIHVLSAWISQQHEPPPEKAFPIPVASELGSATALPLSYDYSRSSCTLNSTASLMPLFVLPPRAWRPFARSVYSTAHPLCFPSQIDWTANRPAWIIHTLPGDKPISTPTKSRKKRSDRHASDETEEDVGAYSPNNSKRRSARVGQTNKVNNERQGRGCDDWEVN